MGDLRACANVAVWAGRLLGLGLVGLVAVFAIGEGLPGSLSLQHASLLLAMAGFLVAFAWPLGGGMLGLLGTVLFYALDFAGYHRLPGGPVFPIFWIASILLVSGGLMKAMVRHMPRHGS